MLFLSLKLVGLLLANNNAVLLDLLRGNEKCLVKLVAVLLHFITYCNFLWITIDYYRLLQITIEYYRLLQITIEYRRLL